MMDNTQTKNLTNTQNPNDSVSVGKSSTPPINTVGLRTTPVSTMQVMMTQEMDEVKEFVDNANVYTSISEITIENQYLIIYFTNGLTFNCGRVKGTDGKTPVIEIGTITTLDPGKQATGDIVHIGETEDGSPLYRLDLSIPKGDKGDTGDSASGNVQVTTDNLLSGRQYAFVPSENGSANGRFVEIVTNEAPSDGNAYGQKNKSWVRVVEHEDGKGLSTNDLTNELLERINNLANYDDTTIKAEIENIKKQLDTLFGEGVSDAIDTFNEIEEFLAGISDSQSLNDILNNLSENIIKLIPTKLSDLQNDANYVSDAYYVHTDNNFSTLEKAKLEGLENYDDSAIRGEINNVKSNLDQKQDKLVSGTSIKTVNGQSILGEGNISIEAPEQHQADWNETNPESTAFIKNKPTIPNVDVDKAYVDSKISEVNESITGLESGKANKEEVNSALSGKVDKVDGKGLSDENYTAEEKQKLASIDEGANKYVLPNASSLTLGGVKIGNNITHNSGVISLTKENVVNALGFNPEDNDSALNIGNLIEKIIDSQTISDSDLALIEESISSGKCLYCSGQDINVPISTFYNGNLLYLYYYLDFGYLVQHVSARINTETKAVEIINTPVQSQILKDYSKPSSYEPIKSNDTIRTAIGKLEAGLESAGGSEVVVITYAASYIPVNGDIININQEKYDKLVDAIKNDKEIVVETQCARFKAYGSNYGTIVKDDPSVNTAYIVFFSFPNIGYNDITNYLNFMNCYVIVPYDPKDDGTYDLVFSNESPLYVIDIDLSDGTKEGVTVSVGNSTIEKIMILLNSSRVRLCAKAPHGSATDGFIFFQPVFENDEYVMLRSEKCENGKEYGTWKIYELKILKTDYNIVVYAFDDNTSVTKESIESVLTGNIASHRHDTIFQEVALETDVWDGTTVSTSLQGSGTKDDPYLIQSCADWAYLHNNADKYDLYNVGGDASDLAFRLGFKPVFKVTKNLDFNHQEITVTSMGNFLYFPEFNGNGARISNFKTTTYNNVPCGVFPICCMYPFIHDFVLDGIDVGYNVDNIDDHDLISIWCNAYYDTTVTAMNNIMRLNVTIEGNITENLVVPFVAEGNILADIGDNNVLADEVNYYLKEHGRYLGLDVQVTDNTTKPNDAKLAVAAYLYSVLLDEPLNAYIASPLIEASFSSSSPVITESGFCIVSATTSIAHIYTNNEGSNTILLGGFDSSESYTFTGTPKTLDEMRSASFVDEFNASLPIPALKQDLEGGTPILIQYGAINYDGYVKKSVFDAYKRSVPEIPAKTSDLYNDSDFVASSGLKTINGESIVGSGNIVIESPENVGNVKVTNASSLRKANFYAFKPSVDGSAEGTFSLIPNATESKEGLMSSFNYRKLYDMKPVIALPIAVLEYNSETTSETIEAMLKTAFELDTSNAAVYFIYIAGALQGEYNSSFQKFYIGDRECMLGGNVVEDGSSVSQATLEFSYVDGGKLHTVAITMVVSGESGNRTYTYSAKVLESGDDTYYLPSAVDSLNHNSTHENILAAFGGSIDEVVAALKGGKRITLTYSLFGLVNESLPVSASGTGSFVVELSYYDTSQSVLKEITCNTSDTSQSKVKEIAASGYPLKPSLYTLTSSSTSDEISTAVGGGESGLKAIIQAVKDGNRLVIRGTLDDIAGMTINQDVQCNMYREEDNGDMRLLLSGKGYGMWGAMGGILSIAYTKSSNTFSCDLVTD